ncbi:MAG: PHB depolymerase family esterase [Bdellovibrionota bacterium]
MKAKLMQLKWPILSSILLLGLGTIYLNATQHTYILPAYSDGSSRASVKIHLPSNYASRSSWPVLISLHGFHSDQLVQYNLFRLHELVDELGFILVTPSGRKEDSTAGWRFWDANNFCCNFTGRSNSDFNYLKDLVNTLNDDSSYSRIDLNKVYFFGHSNGGAMSYKMACGWSKVKGIISVAGFMSRKDDSGNLISTGTDPCPDEGPTKIVQIHGTDDDSIFWNGDVDSALPGSSHNQIWSVPQLMENWLVHNNCTSTSDFSASSVNAVSSTSGNETEVRRYHGCDSGGEVVRYKVDNGTHNLNLRKSFLKSVLAEMMNL